MYFHMIRCRLDSVTDWQVGCQEQVDRLPERSWRRATLVQGAFRATLEACRLAQILLNDTEDFGAKSARARLSQEVEAKRLALLQFGHGASLRCSADDKNRPPETKIRKSANLAEVLKSYFLQECRRVSSATKMQAAARCFLIEKHVANFLGNISKISALNFPERKLEKNCFCWKIQGPKTRFK